MQPQLRRASSSVSSDQLLNAPEDGTAAAEAAEAAAEAADSADAPVRAVLQDALVSSDEGVRDFLYRCTTMKKDGRQITGELRGGGAVPSAAAPSTLLQSLLQPERQSAASRQSTAEGRQSTAGYRQSTADKQSAAQRRPPCVGEDSALQLPGGDHQLPDGALRAAGGRAGARGACLELVSTEARYLRMLRGVSDAVGAAGLAPVAPPPLAFLLSTLELLLPLHAALAERMEAALAALRPPGQWKQLADRLASEVLQPYVAQPATPCWPSLQP